jgi:putative chitinase
MTLDQLRRIMPNTLRGAVFFNALTLAMAESGITTARDQAAFLATVGNETGQLSSIEENLNYSAERLMAVWPKRFPTMASAAPYARNPPALANRVYANRGGNGDEKSGDGYRYRGAGCIQLTFHDNHMACAAHFGIPPDVVGDWMRTPTGAARSAGWFWSIHKLSHVTDFDKVCDLVNIGHCTEKIGDPIGYADRLALFDRALAVLS